MRSAPTCSGAWAGRRTPGRRTTPPLPAPKTPPNVRSSTAAARHLSRTPFDDILSELLASFPATHDRPQTPALARLVRRPVQRRHDRALPRALHEFRPLARRAAV